MPQDRRIRIVDRFQQPVRHLFALLVKERVHAGNHDVHLRQHVIGEVKIAFTQDVDLHPGKNLDPFHAIAGLADALDVREGALIVKPVGERQVFGMIRNSHVLIAECSGRRCHLFNRVPAVGFDSVHVHVTQQVGGSE